MAKKLDAGLAKRIKALGIEATSEDDARKKLLKRLEKEGVEGMEDEDTDTLIDMVDSFVENENDEDEVDDEEVDEVEDEEEEEMDALAAEVEAEEEDNAPEVETNDSNEEEEDEVEDTESDDKEEDEVEDEKKLAPKKPAAKKKETKKVVKKETKKEETKKSTKRGVKLNPKLNSEDRKAFDAFKEVFDDKDYTYDWISSYGATIKHNGKNSKRGVLTVENVTRNIDGTLTCNIILLTMAKEVDKLDELGIDYKTCWTKAPIINNILIDDAVEIVKKLYDSITSFVNTVDKRLGDNRKKMEESLKKTTATTDKKTAKTKKSKE